MPYYKSINAKPLTDDDIRFADFPIDVTVQEIDVNGKYIISFSEYMPLDELEKIKDTVNEWLKNDKTFLVLNGMRLIKVDE